jgi:hypothetical protein
MVGRDAYHWHATKCVVDCKTRSPSDVLAMYRAAVQMKTSITWGALVGVALGATVTFALSRGWVDLPWHDASAAERAPTVQHDDPRVHGASEVGVEVVPVRPLRPGSSRAGVAASGHAHALSRA